MLRSYLRHASLLLALSILALAARGAEVRVFAAASLSDVLRELGQRYEATSHQRVQFNFAASSLLARQIKEGAPADLFFSADEAKMDDLAKAGLIAAESRRTVLANTLVLVVAADDTLTLTTPQHLTEPGIRRIALGETQTVPAGIYAKAYLQKAGLWDQLSAKVVPTENVRAALAAVENGHADVALVYKTDALISKKVKVAFQVPIQAAPPILYPLAVLKDSKNAAEARALAEFLTSKDAWAVFAKHGFLPAP